MICVGCVVRGTYIVCVVLNVESVFSAVRVDCNVFDGAASERVMCCVLCVECVMCFGEQYA